MKKVLIVLSLIIVVVSCSKKEEKLPPVGLGYIVENLESMPYYADTLLPEKFEKHNLTLAEPAKTIRAKEFSTIQASPQSPVTPNEPASSKSHRRIKRRIML